MSTFEEHCRDAIDVFGDSFPHVHQWLDEFAGKPGILSRHRKYRHHLVGIEECRKLFGDHAADVARQHIIADLKLEGWNENDEFPKDESDYKRLGFW